MNGYHPDSVKKITTFSADGSVGGLIYSIAFLEILHYFLFLLFKFSLIPTLIKHAKLERPLCLGQLNPYGRLRMFSSLATNSAETSKNRGVREVQARNPLLIKLGALNLSRINWPAF